ncbi:ribonuclease E [Saccharopolyspora erythraea NRRL 2338]|uniref:Ribonuclease E n=1 Tax=Saccharopolyspora erythraea (strain ATCC 11635 / DSM 40517 / JCM 4748 / NBRC 13426 / NCIMB 8594 / NRRL 2338) TaxID=405948 RepID=A4F9K3_SACEN|nr:translation initiation factor IF-2 N-terminal domain-containing protein [Saccharopolyspora erythraea]PFG94514.1 ribonuclease E [Saccharopolyspora erythraea NRRL 2338]QRK91265.1 translation initiation factor IF-2 N-terminal domain-containing protein [Saccharopolyspora erythraea]CAM00728.1 ribonuclease, Rne/Rng family [Saccharopolyspora erythraea NRRL 2338]
MLNMDTPAGSASGPSPTPTQEDQGTFELPAKLRVHALAKLLGASSREIITTLESLGESVRSAQSNITREVAMQVVRTLHPEQIAEPEQGAEDTSRQQAAGKPEEPAQPQAQPGAESARKQQAQPTRDEESAEGKAAESKPAEGKATEGEAGDKSAEVAPVKAPNPGFLAAQESEPTRSGAPGLTPVFAAPQAMFLAPDPKTAPAKPEPEQKQAQAEEEQQETATEAPQQSESADTGEDEGDQGGRRRRRRGRRGRGRGRGAEGEQDEQQRETSEADTTEQDGKAEQAEPATEQQSEEAAEAAETDGDSAEGNRRRRRRRRRKGSGDDDSGTRDDDPPNTVVHVRESAPEGRHDSSDDEVRAVKGSTRLEAKRQRRRDGREAGRRRAPVLSEAEFLARRESVDRRMVVRENGDQTQIAVLEDNVLVENFVTSAGSGSLVGNVYLGRVQNVLPSMEAAFVDIGRGRNAVLYAGEVDWDAAGLAGKARRIEQALSTGDSVLVQVTKDPVGHKGARLTTQISLPGRFLVYVPGGGATGISRKLPDNERKRLKEILKRIVPENAGVIIRTASEGTSEEALDRDVRRLQAQWEVIKEKADSPKAQAPQLLYEEPDLLIKVVRDLFTEDFSAMAVQGNQAWDTIEAYVKHVAPDLAGRLSKHVGKNDVFTEQRISEQIAKALDRKVWLPSGGYLVIDRTEAMTVIDVNTGKFTGSGGNLEETVTRNNLEAAEEIVRQLRLRDIGGIIVIDFIDMVLESNRDLVLRRLTECLGRDRTRHQVAEVTSLGLVQMTRKRVGTGLLEAYSSTCEHCRGRGLLVSTDPVTHAHTNGSGGGGGGGRRNRNRGKSQEPETPVVEAAPAAEPEAKAEPAAEAPKPEKQEKPQKQEKAERKAAAAAEQPVRADKAPEPAKAEQPVEAERAEPVKATEPAPAPEAVEEPVAEQPEAAAPAAEPVRASQPEEAAPTPASQPEPAAEESSEPAVNGRARRRKVSRPAGSAGAPAAPVVVAVPAKPAESSESQDNGVPSTPPPAAAAVSRRRGRSASRPAGPPVDGGQNRQSDAAADGAAGTSEESGESSGASAES